MATYVELKRERELLADLGLPTQKHWPPRCNWYNEDGSLYGELPADIYSRLRYMERGLKPEITLADFEFWERKNFEEKYAWCGTWRASEFHARKLEEEIDPHLKRERQLEKLVKALLEVMDETPPPRRIWRGTASDLLQALEGKMDQDDIPVDATRLSKELNESASQLLDMDIIVEHVRSAKKREIILRRQFTRL